MLGSVLGGLGVQKSKMFLKLYFIYRKSLEVLVFFKGKLQENQQFLQNFVGIVLAGKETNRCWPNKD